MKILMNPFTFFKKEKPNVIFLFIDASGREDVFKKIEFYQQLKKEGVFVENLICYAPYSLGSLNALFSGMNGNLNGVDGYYKAYSFDKKKVYTLTQYLKRAGYRTELDFVIPDVVPPQGFDKIRTFGKDEDREIDLVQRHGEILTRLKGKQPFFAFLDYNKIALSLVKPVIKKYDDSSEEYFEKKEENLKNFTSYVQESAVYVEKMLQKLKELNLYDNSIIVIFSDHGCSVGDKMGEKVYGTYLYDYTIKCWAILIGKNFPKAVAIENQMRHIDILPTILEILGLKTRDDRKPIQGKSMLPSIDGKEEEKRVAYSETGGLGGPTPSPDIHNVQSVRTNEWKLIYNKTNKKKELYNLKEDELEEKNLAGTGLDVEEQLWTKMKNIEGGHNRINKKWSKD